MVGPVFQLELMHGRHRRQHESYRLAYVGWLLAELLVVVLHYSSRIESLGYHFSHPNVQAGFVRDYINLFVVQQLVMLFIAVPSFTAGSITDAKTRGTLQDLLATDLTTAQILVGKLLAQLAQIGELAA